MPSACERCGAAECVQVITYDFTIHYPPPNAFYEPWMKLELCEACRQALAQLLTMFRNDAPVMRSISKSRIKRLAVQLSEEP